MVTWTLGTIIALFTVLGLIVKFVLVPYLKEHLVDPMKQVEKQVSENHHSNEVPTVLDRIDDVSKAVTSLRDELKTEVRVLASMYEGHMEWSDRWVKLIEREIDHIRGTEEED